MAVVKIMKQGLETKPFSILLLYYKQNGSKIGNVLPRDPVMKVLNFQGCERNLSNDKSLIHDGFQVGSQKKVGGIWATYYLLPKMNC